MAHVKSHKRLLPVSRLTYQDTLTQGISVKNFKNLLTLKVYPSRLASLDNVTGETIMAVFHYSRVSTDEQSVENQRITAEDSDYKVDHWFYDKGVSGGILALDRKYFKLMSDQMVEGDCLLVSSVDRIGRNTADVIKTIEHFQSRNIKVCVLAYGSLDLTSEIGMAMISIAAVFAQLERSYLKTRTKAGMKRVKEAGVKIGQPLKITPDNLSDIVKERAQGVSFEAIGKKYSMSKNTIQLGVKRWGGDLDGYRKEFATRQQQYSSKML